MRAAILGVAALAVLETGCLVQITKVSNPGPLFEAAKLEAARYAGRKGPAHEVNVLVFEPDEQQLVRVSVPIWLVKKMEGHVDWNDVDLDDESADHVRRVLKRRIRIEDLEKAGLGTLVEVEEHDGEQVLVWLK
jgi:hypothetical protein